ncbi:MAG: MFS transporter, partial [Solirubrobacterales bacterium]
ITAPMIALSPLGGRLIALIGTRPLMTCGMALGTAGLVVLALVGPSTGYGVVFGGYLLFGLALGFVYAPMSAAAMTAMPQDKAGIAAGVLAMNRVLAGALTLAVAGALFQHVLVDDTAAHEPVRSAYTSALSAANWVLVALCAIGTVLTWAFVRDAQPGAHRHHRHLHF